MYRRVLSTLITILVFQISHLLLKQTSGILCFLVTTVMVVSLILAVKKVSELCLYRLGLNAKLNWLNYLAITAGAIAFSFLILEIMLQVLSLIPNSADEMNSSTTVTIPRKWDARQVEIKGTEHSYYWHNVLHVYNKDGMRWIGELPGKGSGVFRIIAMGDSLTYGYGIAQEFTYPSVIQQELEKSFRVEVLNLGVCGSQSEDVFRILRKQFPRLKPDLVVYGVCLNDFLPPV